MEDFIEIPVPFNNAHSCKMEDLGIHLENIEEAIEWRPVLIRKSAVFAIYPAFEKGRSIINISSGAVIETKVTIQQLKELLTA